MLNRNPSDLETVTLREAQDERALRLLHRARDLRGLTSEQVRRIASRLDAPGAPARRRALVPVLVGLALLLSAGTALAWATGTLEHIPLVRVLLTSHRSGEMTSGPARVTPGSSLRASEGVAAAESARAAEPSAPTPAPPPPAAPDEAASAATGKAELRSSGNRHRAAATRAPAPAAALEPARPAMVESPIAREGESFANVLRRWRRDHDGQAALAGLDFHERTFAGGQLALESRLLRVEVLLAEHREREALAILDRLPFDRGNVPRGRELVTLRGELRINAGRCQDGRADLASIGGGTDALADRARHALARCP